MRGIVDPTVEIGVPAGKALVSLGRAAAHADPSPETVQPVVTALGPEAALTAIEVTGAFQMTNRVMEATGQPVLVKQRENALPNLEALGAMQFHGSGLTVDRASIESDRGFVRRLKAKLRSSGSGRRRS